MARKEISYGKMNEKEKLQLLAEVNILRELKHPNIVRYYERFVDKERSIIYIFMEYCEGGDLASLIRQARKEKYNRSVHYYYYYYQLTSHALSHRHIEWMAILDAIWMRMSYGEFLRKSYVVCTNATLIKMAI